MLRTVWWFPLEAEGRVGIVDRPRGGDWLDDDLARLRSEGVDVLVSLLETQEEKELLLENEKKLWNSRGGEFHAYPITDRETPASLDETCILINKLAAEVNSGRRVGIHCRMGLGRSAVIVVAVALAFGVTVEEGFRVASEIRGYRGPDTQEQIEWTQRLKEKL